MEKQKSQIKDLIHQVAERLTAPCIGKDLGANFNQLLSYYKGLFMAPTAVSSALKTMVFASRMLEKCGFNGISPKYDEKRTDIIQTIRFDAPEPLMAFCKELQANSPIESYLTPIPDDVPGYDNKLIMAGGSFVEGSTIELSADGPLRPPYAVYMQGGLNYAHVKIAMKRVLQELLNE